MYRSSGFVVALTSLLTFFLCLSTGCGSDRRSSSQDSGPPQYQVSLVNTGDETSLHGQISVDTSGLVTTELTGATASTAYTVQFCPAPAQDYSCFNVGDLTTDGSGNAKTTFKFPTSGSWAGDFQVTTGGATQFQTDIAPSMIAGQVYLAALQPSSTANGHGIFINNFVPSSQDPLSSGTIRWSNNMLQEDLKGASPNTTYGAGECPIYFGSNCYALYDQNMNSAFTTDANGDVSFSVSLDGVSGDILEVDAPADRAGFVAGFKVP